MEYRKEDLMEAKKQILGVGENMGTEESKKIWEENAQFWDNAMGDESNEFHREVVRPKVTELLSPNPADYILDIACGNGNYSSYLAQRGASVVAFDYSKKMIELAKRRQSQYAKQIEFCVADATNRKSILELKRNRAFTKAVSNMAIMDITDIEPLLMAVYELLQESGIFVFATQHPCFVTLTEKYMTPHSYYDIAIEGQPKEQIYYHRSIQDIFNLCFRAGFVIDGFYEECFKTNKEIPMVMIVRLKKVKRDSLTVFIICFSLQILFDFRKRGFPVPENRRAYNIQQFANFRVAHIQEVGQKDNVAFPFGQSVKGFGKQFIFDEYIKAGHLKTEIIAFVFVRCEKLREFAFAQIRKSNFACCAFRKSAAVAFRFADQSFLC